MDKYVYTHIHVAIYFIYTCWT